MPGNWMNKSWKRKLIHKKKTVSDTSTNKDTLSKEKGSENENEDKKLIKNDFARYVGTFLDADLKEQILKLGPYQPEEAIGLAKKWGITPEFEKRDLQKLQFFDDFNADEKLQDKERLFEVNVFKANIESNRFESMNGIYKSFSFLSPKNIVSTTNGLLHNKASNLQKVYSLDLSSKFPNQIMSLKAVFSEDLSKLNSIKDLGNFLMIQNKFAAPSLPDVCIAVLLFLTLPVTSAMAERLFSKLKLIKNYLRCMMSEERLAYLSLISIEQQEARKIELDELKTDLAKKNVRRQSLFCDLLLECSSVY
ncbi:uncharacterized protein TNCV_4833381 [Trichonephila clavipes]|nr:uncharacterized protein TNCV_4833381 [Trichonephila clavipes]